MEDTEFNNEEKNSWNKWIYSSVYTPESQIISLKNKYAESLFDMRLEMLEKYVSGIAVDMGCGIGEFTRIASRLSTRMIGVDFSEQYIKRAIELSSSEEIEYRLESVSETGIESNTIDCLFCYSTLYTIPQVEKTINHFFEILNLNGIAILDFGNSKSLMNLFYSEHNEKSTAQTFNIPVNKIRSTVTDAGFEILEWRSFQLLPMQGLSKKRIVLWPLTTKLWQNVLRIQIRNRMIDEVISSSFLRKYAFRHIIVARKANITNQDS